MEPEQSKNFNERLSQWVAHQGFWFQIRYSMSSSGTRGRALFHALNLSFRLLIFVLVATAATWVYLVKQADNPKFQNAIRLSLETGLSANESQLRGFSQIQGRLGISRFACQGGKDAFFTTMEARNIRCQMGLLDGLRGQWNPGTILISKLDMELRAGSDDASSAQAISDAIFRKFPKVVVHTIEVADASLRWGFSDPTQGAIQNSELKILRYDGGMKMVFRGGTFSQNWLRNLTIESLIVVCDSKGFTFEKAEFKQGTSVVNLTGIKVIGGERPTVIGLAKVRNIPLESVLPTAFRSFVEGTFSGDFKLSGSTNASEGIGFEGQVVLDGQDIISLRERVHLLKALSVVDYSRNYHRVDFSEGSFQIKTTGGGLILTDVNLKASDLFTLEGSMRVRLPTAEETKLAVEQTAKNGAPIFLADDGKTDDQQTKDDTVNFTLKRAALEAKRLKEGTQVEGPASLFDRLGLSLEMRRLEEQASERLSRMLRYEGSFKISVPFDAFERTPRLSVQYPIDPETHRIPITVPIEGSLYEITLKQAEEIYQQGRR